MSESESEPKITPKMLLDKIEQTSQRIESLETSMSGLSSALERNSAPEHEHVPSPSEDLKLHKDYAEALDCPDCYPKIKGLIPSLRSKLKEDRKDKPFECVNCGVGVDVEEKDCPWCGNKRARKRRK